MSNPITTGPPRDLVLVAKPARKRATRAAATTGTATTPVVAQTELEPIQLGLFVAEFAGSELPIKDDMSSMEHPLFAVSKTPDNKVREYRRGNQVLKVFPSTLGAPTIFDKDLVLWVVSHIARGKDDGLPISRRVQVNVTDFLKGTKRSTGGASYERVVDMCRRLAGARIETNIRTTDAERTEGFGMIESYKVTSQTRSGKGALQLEVVISEWLWRAATEFHVLTLNPSYFVISQGLERRLYELARKHCGDQAWWVVGLDVLQQKVGSDQKPKYWTRDLRQAVEADQLPDYRMYYDAAARQLVFFTRDTRKLLAQATSESRIESVSMWLQKSV